ncbi:MAG: extracellular solute-binding protein [Erysipelotrichaceae bacterium]|jgi:arabinogalactan oligomer/maltooligosaccharide transport system substrate-binding protein|nr:extracellular solute-binding protein [Erysipelotrichaceae bacterium]
MKRILALCLTLVLLLSMLGGCSSNSGSTSSGDTIVLKVWGSQEDQVILGVMIESFKAAHPDKTFDISLGVVGESDAKSKYLEDPEAAADVFAFANDQLKDLVAAGALYEVTRNKDSIVAANIESSIAAATLDGKLYAYPMTADNGYFLYYDKSVFSEADIASLDKMLEVAGAANKKVFMDVSNGWYIASFFLGAGLRFADDGKIDWNNATGEAVGEYIKSFTANKAFLTGDDDILKSGFADGSIAAGVSGTWNAANIAEILGDNYGAAKLPTFSLNGVETQMGSFGGFKLIGVNSQTKYPVEAMDLAEWLTNEENQIYRFEERALGPSNIKAAESDAVKEDAALAALAAQAPYAVDQNNVPGTYWNPAEAFGTALESKDYSKSIADMLNELVTQSNSN